MDRRTSCKTIVLITSDHTQHIAHQCFPCCLLNPPIPEKKAAAAAGQAGCVLCAAGLPKEGAQYCVVW
jgi:hypothetical protein